jgi:hypothetical protein
MAPNRPEKGWFYGFQADCEDYRSLCKQYLILNT